MAIDLVAPFTELAVRLRAIPGIQKVYEGVPEQLQGVSAYMAGTAQDFTDLSASLVMKNECTYFVALAYQVAGAETTAERKLLLALRNIMTMLIQSRKDSLGGTVDSISWDFTLASDPAYQVSVGREFRVFPILIKVVQRENMAGV